jgi:hypothetical protein
MSSFRFFIGPMLAQRYISRYGLRYGSWLHESIRLYSIDLVKRHFAPLAQLAEQVTLNHWVAGSIPARCISSHDD